MRPFQVPCPGYFPTYLLLFQIVTIARPHIQRTQKNRNIAALFLPRACQAIFTLLPGCHLSHPFVSNGYDERKSAKEYKHVSQVKYSCPQTPYANIHKINHSPVVHEPVQQVAEATPQNEYDGQGLGIGKFIFVEQE